MKGSTIALAATLVLAFMALPAIAPVTEDLSIAGGADAAPPCVIGQNDCIIPMYCVMEPCPSWP